MTYELLLFAAVGFAIGGLDDLFVDLIWIGRYFWRRAAIYTRHERASVETLTSDTQAGRLAIFIPAWQESEVIGPMLDVALASWGVDHYTIFVGCYPNDVQTRAVISGISHPALISALVPHNGPTTKADCLNAIWQKLLRVENETGKRFCAIILHDAEDVVHRNELTLYSRLISRFALIQIPVEPLMDRNSRWISGHYLDEFAEAHGKAMVVRESVGAALPSAGVGCAIRRDALDWLAAEHNNRPFSSDSLTEDYELGLRIAMAGYRTAFVRLPDQHGRRLVAVRAHFPDTLSAAVKQKARWTAGIALSGWSRLGWEGGLFEHWMRLRDRRAIFAAIVIVAGYSAIASFAVSTLFNANLPKPGPWLSGLLALNAALLIWRLAMRFGFVTHIYGWREGMRSPVRMAVSNLITVLASARALYLYISQKRSGVASWSKTAHKFPDIPT